MYVSALLYVHAQSAVGVTRGSCSDSDLLRSSVTRGRTRGVPVQCDGHERGVDGDPLHLRQVHKPRHMAAARPLEASAGARLLQFRWLQDEQQSLRKDIKNLQHAHCKDKQVLEISPSRQREIHIPRRF